MTILESERKTITTALYLAAEWEESIMDSLSTALEDPVFAKQYHESSRRRDEFRALQKKFSGTQKTLPALNQ